MNMHDELGRLEARLGRLQPLATELNREEFYFRAGQEAGNAHLTASSRKWMSFAIGSVAATLVVIAMLVTQQSRFDRRLADLRPSGVSTKEQTEQPVLSATAREPDSFTLALAAELAMPLAKTSYFHSRRRILKHARAWEMAAVDPSAAESQVWQPREGVAVRQLRRRLEIELLY